MARKSERFYDPRNRLTELTFGDDLGEQVWTYTDDGLPATITTYNAAGRTVPVINAYSYNKRRMLGGQGESLQQPGWYTWSMGYGYDSNGALANHVYPDGLLVDYAPNALGQATKAGPYAADVKYFPNGAIKSFWYGNSLTHALDQNARQLPMRSRDAIGATVVLDDSYDYDFNGNVAAISDALPGNVGHRTMTYDGLDRLVSATSTGMFNGTINYTYDVLDNLATVVGNGRNDRYCYHATTQRLEFLRGATGACTSANPAKNYFEFDVQGNLRTKDGATFAFGQNNRLYNRVGVEYYRYDGHGRRILGWSPATGSIFSMYDQGGVLRHVQNERKGIDYDYIYLGGSLVASREKLRSTGALTVKYQHTDALGTPVAVTDAARNVIERSRYEPYGKVLNRVHDDEPGFTGHMEDALTGLTYMQQRYYDPLVGRFLSVDPMAVDTNTAWNFNRYNYAGGNPYKYTDPDGRVLDTAVDAGLTLVDGAKFAGAVLAFAVGKVTDNKALTDVAVEGMQDTGGDVLMSAGAMAVPFVSAPMVKAADKAVDVTRAGYNGVEGPVQLVNRTTRSGQPAARITYPDGSIKDVSPTRVKEFVPNAHPKAPPGTPQRVKFENAQPGTKGYKRDPTPEDLQEAGI